MLEGERPEQQRFEDEYFDDEEDALPSSSLTEDLTALFGDGKTYAEAEFAFQRSRLAYSGKKGRQGALFVIFALFFVHLALVALVIGSVIALSPILTPLGATMLVAMILLLTALLFVRMAKRRFGAITEAFRDTGND